MFVSRQHHPQLLGPECYHSQDFFEQEVQDIFLHSWICIGAVPQMPRDGDFITLELFGRPLLIRRHGHRFHTYLNVCAHRYCMLTCRAHGCMPTLRCQYHGWEYDEHGDTRKIPESKTFRPLAPGTVGLTTFRTETCGQLIFVTLGDQAPPLREFLAEGYTRLERWFHPDLTFVGAAIRDVPANWKVVIENGLESYHITECHARTFGKNPPEETCTHHLHDQWTALNVAYGPRWLDWLASFYVGVRPTYQYDHLHYFPSLMPGRLSVNTWVESILPVSPTRTHNLGIAFCYAGRPGRLWTRWMAFWIRRWARRWHVRVNSEDQVVIASTQQGLGSPQLPKGGLISTREERIFHFQRYVQRATGAAAVATG